MALSVTKDGIKVFWGTDGLLGGTLLTALVEEVTFKPQVERAKIPDNNGFTVGRVSVDDGFEATVKLTYEETRAYPEQDDVVLLKRRSDGALLRCLVDEIEHSATRKKENMITLKISYFPGMTV
jgi:hypothetical protein